MKVEGAVSEDFLRGVAAERRRLVHCLLAFQSMMMGPDTEPRVLATWSIVLQDILGIDGCGTQDEVAQRYIARLNELNISAELINIIESKYSMLMDVMAEHMQWAAVAVSGSGGETSIRTVDAGDFDMVMGSKKSHGPSN